MVSKINIISSTLVFTCLFSMVFDANAESLNVEQYQQAERQLGKHTEKLVTGTLNKPSWTDNNQLTYSSNTEQGEQFFIFDVATKEKDLAFDHQKLATALSTSTKQEAKAEAQQIVIGNYKEVEKWF